jgi:hypothetical protein
MAGPFQPHPGTDPIPSQPAPQTVPYPDPAARPYPATLPPPLPYPQRRRAALIIGVLIALLAVAGLVTAVVFGVRHNGSTPPGALTPQSAERAIQNYLNALADGDIQTIARNTLCGLYDGVKDRRTDDALARLSSETFRKQFTRADVTSVDTVVFTSVNSAQALFTMRVAPAAGNRSDDGAERQAVAQLLTHNGEVLVCSYVQRTAGAF